MRYFFFGVAYVTVATGCIVAAGDPTEASVMMRVEEVSLAKSVRAGAPIEASFAGFLTNGCQRFDRLAVTETPGAATVAMWATERRPADAMCTADIREVRETRSFVPATAGRFVLTVRQPAGPPTVREVFVE